MKKILTALPGTLSFFLGLLLGLYFIAMNITGKSFTELPGDLGDSRFTNYLLEHSHQYFKGQVTNFWDAGFMVPESNIVTYSENMVGSAPFYSMFRIAGYDRETSFQAWFLVIIILNYTFCYFFLKKLFKNPYAAVLGAMVFAFSMALQSQMGHPQTFPRFSIPLAFWMGILFLEKMKPLYFFLALFFVVYTLYCCIYTGLMLAVPVGLLIITGLVYQWKLLPEKCKNYRWSGAMVLSIILNILIVLPLMLPYRQRGNEAGFNNYEGIFSNILTIKSYFFSQSGSLFWDFLRETGIEIPGWWDHQIFAGGVATICMFLFMLFVILKLINKKILSKLPLERTSLVFFITALLCFFLFLRIGDFSLYKQVMKLPGFASMRAIQRIINIELIFFAIATAFVFSIVLKRKNWLAALLFVIFAGLITADNYYKWGAPYNTTKELAQSRVNKLQEKMKDIPAGAHVSYEPADSTDRNIYCQVDAMLAAQALHLKTVNGYTGTSPGGYGRFWEELSKEGREEWFKAKNFRPDTVYIIN